MWSDAWLISSGQSPGMENCQLIKAGKKSNVHFLYEISGGNDHLTWKLVQSLNIFGCHVQQNSYF